MEAIFPNLQLAPIQIGIGVVLGVFLAGRFPSLLKLLPSVFTPSPPQLTAEDIRAIIREETAANKA